MPISSKGMPDRMLKKAVADGVISQRQLDRLPRKMVEGLVKRGKFRVRVKKNNKNGKKGKNGKKTAT